MVHYTADTFTAPHNGFWTGRLQEHRTYKAALHKNFETMLRTMRIDKLLCWEYVPLHEAYCARTSSMENNCQHILTACASLLEKYLLSSAKTEGVHHEGLDYRRLSAGDIETIVGGKQHYRALIHKRIPIHSVGIEVLPNYYEDFLKKQ